METRTITASCDNIPSDHLSGAMFLNVALEQAESLQNLLVSRATGGAESDKDYKELRLLFVSDPQLAPYVPSFIRTCRNLSQFWPFIQAKGGYADRRAFIWAAFEPLLTFLERGSAHPSDTAVAASLQALDAEHVGDIWSKALERRDSDPEGAITMARTLLESVCKCILEESDVAHEDAELPKLYRMAAESLNIAPGQHTEQVFKQILGGCASVVEGLGALRNRVGDSHGQGRRPVRPAPRHAELAVNLAGAVATFLVSTWKTRK